MDTRIVYGRHPVVELFSAKKPLEKILLAHSAHGPTVKKILRLAQKYNVRIEHVSAEELALLTNNGNHQNIVAVTKNTNHTTSLLSFIDHCPAQALVVVCDHLQDSHNLGAVIRSAECFGAHAVIIPRARSVGFSPIVNKIAAGAMEHIALIEVANINMTLRELKSSGFWVVGADASDPKADMLNDFIPPKRVSLVVGSEATGMMAQTHDLCDFILKIEQYGSIASLNVSVATGIILHSITTKMHAPVHTAHSVSV